MKKLFFLITVLTVVELGTCLKCYVCTTENKNETCWDAFNKDKHKADTCDSSTDVCVKEKSHSDGFRDSIHRGCFDKNYCEEHGKKSLYCSTCTADLCNSSSILVPSFTVLLLTYLFKHCL